MTGHLVFTDLAAQLLLCIDMILLELIIEILQRFEIFDGLSHLLDSLRMSADALVTNCIAHLAHQKIPLGKLLQQILGS